VEQQKGETKLIRGSIMADIVLEEICKNRYEDLPPTYKIQDLERFSVDWKLYDYQVEALKRALAFIYQYQNDKDSLYTSYLEKLRGNQEVWDSLAVREDDDNFDILSDYYPTENGEISFEHFMNRASFWMATGSGKTLVMIKLVEMLFNLAKAGEIEERNIMVLAPKDDILNQIKEHVQKFNTNGSLKIELRDLREFEHVNKMQQSLYQNNTITVFYYRADNIRSENKEKLLDYKTVLNKSEWYVILDEAHKGNADTSNQQQYYSLLSKNGMLFNFSATFTDDIDIVTTLYNFNLKRFLEDGYGKHVKVVDEDFSSFRNRADDEDFTDEEKRHIVLKSLITFTAVKKHAEELKEYDRKLYHNPLLVTTANQVNTKKADLKIFFEQLAEIGAGNFALDDARNELIAALRNNDQYQFETSKISKRFIECLQGIEEADIYEYVFNANAPGQIEYTKISGNNRELAFRLKSATESSHFAIIYIGDISGWQDNNDVLSNYDKSNTALTDSYFDTIEESDNQINLLLGSRIFTEGWDSNRPNVINFINIGVNDEAKKFVLQTTGRGVRIEPIKNHRNRLKHINNKEALSNVLNDEEQKEILDNNKQLPVESLFVFATDKDVISNVIEGLNKTRQGDMWTNVSGIEKNEIPEDLLVPVYKKEQDFKPPAYKISEEGYNELIDHIGEEPGNSDKRLLMNVPDGVTGQLLTSLNKIREKENYIKIDLRESDFSHPFQELLAINTHLNQKPERIDHYKPVTNEIKHFEKVQTKNIDESTLNKLEKQIAETLDLEYDSKEELREDYKQGKVSDDSFDYQYDLLSNPDFISGSHRVDINKDFLKEHYYRPILLAKQGFDDMYRHIIKVSSEINFLNKLSEKAENGLFEGYEWWYFSKLEENVDDISIPYLDSEKQEFRSFFPDFIFWLKKEDKLYITFVDPKGPRHQTNTTDKIIGFQKAIGYQEKLQVNGCEVIPDLWFYNPDIRTRIEEEYRDNYWAKDFRQMFN
jgi:superfamily II DNA or RNA helicase